MNNKYRISLFSLIMLITISIDSIRNLPIAALFGPQMIVFFIIAALCFLLPTGFVAAELTASHTEHNGIYGWVKHAFGHKTGFLAIWLQWINTLVWYPTTLAFIAGSVAFSISPKLAQIPWLITAIIIVVFWSLTLVNLRGLKSSTRFASLCSIFGMIIPMIIIIGLAVIWLKQGHHTHIHLSAHSIIPDFSNSQDWLAMVAIVTSFLGMELASVHVHKIEHSEKQFPRAILISAVIILVTMMAGSLAIAASIPNNHINLVDGVMQELSILLKNFHLLWLQPIIAIMLIVGGLGSMINWMISPAQGLLDASEDGYLPRYFQKQNKAGVPHRILILQAIIVSFASAAFFLMPSINGSYWILTDLSTELYLAMYLLMFAAALYLYYKTQRLSTLLNYIGGKWAFFTFCILGIIGCLITIVIGFIPPENINTGSRFHYESLFIGGLLIMILPCLLAYRFQQRQSN